MKQQQKPVVTSLSRFLLAVESVVKKWSPDRTFDPWFRGHGDAALPLVPGLYRPENEALEEDGLRDEFRRCGWPYLPGAALEPTDEWEWYFLMRHHSVPSRLLDWSESALVACYFALRDARDGVNAAVWVLDPFALNRKVGRKGDEVLIPSDKRIRRFLPEPFSNRVLPKYPIALQAPRKSNRIAAQKGVFTLHGSSTKALDHYAALRAHLAKITISARHVRLIREQLRLAGISETSVFPDLTALGQELVDYQNYEHSTHHKASLKRKLANPRLQPSVAGGSLNRRG